MEHNLHFRANDFLNRSSRLFASSVEETDDDDSIEAEVAAAAPSLIVFMRCLLILPPPDVQLSVSVEFLRLFIIDWLVLAAPPAPVDAAADE